MGFSLKKLVQGAAADINPFDHGASQGNMNPRSAPQPATTAPQPSLISRGFRDITHNPVTNFVGRDIAKPIAHIPTHVDNFANKSAFGRGLQSAALGAGRSLTGTAQAASGLYDLATPGTGTNRVSKLTKNIGKSFDATAKAEHSNPLLYHGAQGVADALQFATGAGEVKAGAKALSELPKVGGAVKAVSKVSPAISSKVTDLTANSVKNGGFLERTGARAIQNATKPGYQAANVAFTGMQTGKEAAAGKKTTVGGVTTSLVTGGVGLPVAGAVAHEAVLPAVKAVAPIVEKGVQGLKDAHLIAPSKLNPTEVTHLSNFAKQARTGALMDDQTYQNGVAAANKAGLDYRDAKSVNDLLNAHQTHDVRVAQRAQALQDAKNNLLPSDQTGGAKAGNILPDKLLSDTADGASAKPAAQLPTEAVSATGQAAKVNGGALAKNTPVNVDKYLKQQTVAQDAARKAETPQGLNKVATAGSQLKKNLVDSLAPIEDTLGQKVTAKNAASHITPQLDRVLRADTIGSQYIKDNGLAKIIQSAPNTKELDQYLIAKHAPAYEAEHGAGSSGRNLSADAQLVKQLAPKYEAHAQAVNQYSQKILKDAVGYGLISKDTANALHAKYPDYVPLNRVFGENELQTFKGNGSGKASISTQGVVKAGKGSQRAIESPLSSLVDKSIQLVKDGERNKAAQILTGYKDLPGNPFGLRELTKNETVGTKPVISYIDKGVTRQFETTPEIAAAAKSLDKQQLDLVGQVLAAPTRVLRLGATGINPAFAMANVAKDTVSAFINSSHPLRSSVANPQVFVASLKAALNHGSKEYGELVRQGAGGTSFDIARNAPVENIQKIRADKNVGTKTLYTVTHPSQLFRAVENTIGRSEEFNRAMQYYGNKQAAIKAGSSVKIAQTLAAHAARNNTVNFARAGDYGRVANSVLPYLNAGVQGSRTLLRNLKERPVQTGAKLALTAFMPTAVVTAWNTSDPERKAAYDDIKDYEKQGNLIIVPPHPVKDANGKWNVIKIPVSQEIANLSNMVRQGVEAGVHDGSISLASMLGDTVGTVTSLNAQSPRQIANQITPQAIKPGIESLTNQNLFTGNKIVPDSQKNLAPKDQIGTNTSGTAAILGKFSGLSPRHIDNAIRTATGGTGQNAVHYADTLLAKTGAIQPNQVQGKSFQDSVSGRFSGAQGQTPYDIADKTFGSLKKQLEGSPQYQAMQPQDKAKALNRLQTQVTDTYVPKTDKSGAQKPLNTKQQAILSGKADLNSYLTASTGGASIKVNNSISPHSQKVLNEYNTLDSATKKSKAYKENDYDYKVAQAKFDNNVANNSLSAAQKISAQATLQKVKIGSGYSKDTRELFGLNRNELADYLSQDPDGKAKAKQLVAYDQALTNAGVQAKDKFKNGLITYTASRSGGSGRSGSSKKTISSLISSQKSSNAAASKNQTALRNLVKNAVVKNPSGSAKTVQVARATLKKQSVKKQKAKVA